MSHRQVMMIGFENKKRKRKKERKKEPIERYIMCAVIKSGGNWKRRRNSNER